jgi:hypothetical protein
MMRGLVMPWRANVVNDPAATSAGPDRSYVVRPRRCYCTMTVAPIWTRL